MRVYAAGNGSALKTIYCDVFAMPLKGGIAASALPPHSEAKRFPQLS
jgi:hypothetical protein